MHQVEDFLATKRILRSLLAFALNAGYQCEFVPGGFPAAVVALDPHADEHVVVTIEAENLGLGKFRVPLEQARWAIGHEVVFQVFDAVALILVARRLPEIRVQQFVSAELQLSELTKRVSVVPTRKE